MNNILLYFAKPSEENKYYITNALDPIKFDEINSNLFCALIDDIDIASEAIKAASQEFYIDVACYIVDVNIPEHLYKYISSFLKEKQNGVYRLVDIIDEHILKCDNVFKNDFKKYFQSKLSNEVIDTAIEFILIGNSIKASKELFIHRNTLNYRIETVKRITSLDLKQFKDQLAFYGLFH